MNESTPVDEIIFQRKKKIVGRSSGGGGGSGTFLTRVVVKMTFLWERNDSGANWSCRRCFCCSEKNSAGENSREVFSRVFMTLTLKLIPNELNVEIIISARKRPEMALVVRLGKLNDLLTSHNSEMIGCVTMCRHLCKSPMNEEKNLIEI